MPRKTRIPTRTKKSVTAQDIAELAKVSKSTVSRVLSGAGVGMISEGTRERVRAATAQLGYSPDPIARALRGKPTHLIGLIVREIDDPFFARFISIISLQARELGYQLVLGNAHSDPSEALEVTSVFETRHCDGIIILGDLRGDEAGMARIQEDNQAVVALCAGSVKSSVPTINCDNRLGIRLLMTHLHDLGHRRFAFIDGGWLGDIQERKKAFLQYLPEHDLTLPPSWIQADTNDPSGGARAALRLLEAPERPTAIIASDDIMAIGVLKAIFEQGLRVPEDLSVVGFDDIEMARYVSPPLTTVRQPIDEMSRHALDLLFELVQRHTPRLPVIAVPPELVVRGSTGKPK